MANSNKQTELKSTEEANFEMRRSFSWDRAFFTSDGFLAADELSSMIEGGTDDVKYELQKIEELETMEAKLFQEIEATNLKSTDAGKKDSQAKKATAKDAPIKTVSKKSSPSSGGGSPGNNVKPLARRSSKTGKVNADSPSKTPPGISTKVKVVPVKTRVSRTTPASPVSPGSPDSSSSAVSVPQRSKRSSSARSVVNNEKPSTNGGLRNDHWKSSKPAVSLMPKTQSSISLKIKPPPVISHQSSPSSSTTQRPSKSSSSSRGINGSTVNHTSKKASKNHSPGQTSDPNGKHAATTCRTGSTARKVPSAKTVAADNTGSKPNSPKTATAKKQSKGTENILVISPEILDLKGKINALRMEIDMHKKERCNRMVRVESGEANLKTPFAVEESSL